MTPPRFVCCVLPGAILPQKKRGLAAPFRCGATAPALRLLLHRFLRRLLRRRLLLLNDGLLLLLRGRLLLLLRTRLLAIFPAVLPRRRTLGHHAAGPRARSGTERAADERSRRAAD